MSKRQWRENDLGRVFFHYSEETGEISAECRERPDGSWTALFLVRGGSRTFISSEAAKNWVDILQKFEDDRIERENREFLDGRS